MKAEVYHYRDADEWKPFTINIENGRRWNLFCAKLMWMRPDNPYPSFEDYIKFLNKIKNR